MADQEFISVLFYNLFFVFIFTVSTSGWLKGFILRVFPIKTVSKIKYANNFPKAVSLRVVKLNSL